MGLPAFLTVMTCLMALPVAAQNTAQNQDRFFTTTDGVKLHYIEAGAVSQPTIVFVPGWAMPATIWQPQIDAFSKSYHVIAFDPRGQGESDIPQTGYDYERRARDVGELIDTVSTKPAAVVAWSLGVLDTLAYVKSQGDAKISTLVLVDNSIGEDPAPVPVTGAKPGEARGCTRAFVSGLFHNPQSDAYIDQLAAVCARLPVPQATALLSYPVPRTFWREAVYSTAKPILYVVRPRWQEQAKNLVAKDKNAEFVLFPDAGHALFVDEPDKFNSVVRDFLQTKVWGPTP
jgi:microsomal epoxide hydrolase